MAARLSPSQWLTASCSDPNTSDPPVWRRGQRGPDRQTARLAPCLSCQNRQAANRKEQEKTPFKPFCLSIHALFPSDGFGIRQSPLSLHKLWSLICMGLGMWGSDWGITNQHWKRYIILNFYSIAFYSILFSWPYVTGPLVGMCGDGNGRSVSGERETTLRSGQTVNPRDHRTPEQGSVIHGLWVTSLRGDGPIPAWRYCWCRCQRPCIKLFCQHWKYHGYFLWMEIFWFICVFVQSKAKAIML